MTADSWLPCLVSPSCTVVMTVTDMKKLISSNENIPHENICLVTRIMCLQYVFDDKMKVSPGSAWGERCHKCKAQPLNYSLISYAI